MKVATLPISQPCYRLRKLFRMGGLVLLIASIGCAGETSDLTSPSAKAAFQLPTATEASISCDIAVRMSTSRYRVKEGIGPEASRTP